jgi:hypothetical protein
MNSRAGDAAQCGREKGDETESGLAASGSRAHMIEAEQFELLKKKSAQLSALLLIVASIPQLDMMPESVRLDAISLAADLATKVTSIIQGSVPIP